MKTLLACACASLSLVAGATTYDWTGDASTVWDLAALNWTTDGGQTACAFAEGGDAVFDVNDKLTVSVSAPVHPTAMSVTVAADKQLMLDYAVGSTACFSTTMSVEKKGAGTLFFNRENGSTYGSGDFPEGSVLDVQEGTVRFFGRNVPSPCTPRTIVIHPGATLMITTPGSFGAVGSLSSVSIRTAGQVLFSSGASGSGIKSLILEPGATFEANKAGHADLDGILQVQEKVIVADDGKGARTLALAATATADYQRFSADARQPLEFEVGDATGDAATDLTVTGPFSFPHSAEQSVGFRKTGAGTMLWQNGYATGNDALNGTVAVEEGTLLFAAGQTIAHATVAVSSGAAVGGSGALANLSLAEGAGLAVQAGQAAALSVTGDLALPASGFVDVTVPEGRFGNLAAAVLDVAGVLTGDVSGWKVKVNGVETDDATLTLSDNNLTVEVTIASPDYVWTGDASTVWDLEAANWTTDGGQTACAFAEGADAVFDVNDKLTVSVSAPVHPTAMSVTVADGQQLYLDYAEGSTDCFSTTMSVEKKGAGTLFFNRESDTATKTYGSGDFPEGSVLDIQEGMVRFYGKNVPSPCTPRNIVIRSGTTLMVTTPGSFGAIGSSSPVSIQTAGRILFSSGPSGSGIKNLILEPGATFEANKAGHADLDGILQVQEKVVVAGDGKGARTLALTATATADYQRFSADARQPLEFEVGDATGDAATDLTVTGPFSFPHAAEQSVGFRKTGAGTMLWQNSYAAGNDALNDTIAVEGGTLLFKAGQTIAHATVAVSSGAAVGGGATLGGLTLAEGACLVAQGGQMTALRVLGDVALPQTATIDIVTDDGLEPSADLVAHVLSVKGAVSGDVSGWQLKVNGAVSSAYKFMLEDGEITIGKFDYVWTGAESSVWDLSAQNWTTDDGANNCAFVSGYRANFVVSEDLTVKTACAVNPYAVCVSNATGTLKIDLSDGGKNQFASTKSVVKKGLGTLFFNRENGSAYGTGGFPADSVLDIQEGMVRIFSRNTPSPCMPCNVIIRPDATFYITSASSVGVMGALSSMSIRTAGELLVGSGASNGNGIRNLILEPGATFVANVSGHTFIDGLLQIQEKVIVEGDGKGARTLSLSTPTAADFQRFSADARQLLEFEVGDATGDAATDLTVTGPFAFQRKESSLDKTEDKPVGFRKTGAGTMLWQNSYAAGNDALNDTIAVEGGTLLFAAGQTIANASVDVTSDAAVGGSGTLANLTLAEGAGLVVSHRNRRPLTVDGPVTIPESGTLVLNIPDGVDPSAFYGYFLKATSYEGVENLKNWTVVVPGRSGDVPELVITETGDGLCFGSPTGFTLIIR